MESIRVIVCESEDFIDSLYNLINFSGIPADHKYLFPSSFVRRVQITKHAKDVQDISLSLSRTVFDFGVKEISHPKINLYASELRDKVFQNSLIVSGSFANSVFRDINTSFIIK